jgi:hypothetical protein
MKFLRSEGAGETRGPRKRFQLGGKHISSIEAMAVIVGDRYKSGEKPT